MATKKTTPETAAPEESAEAAAEATEETAVETTEEPPAETAEGETPAEQAEESPGETTEEEPAEEVHELSRPAVIDLKALLTPISDENPSGESVRYSGIYDEINEARRADDDLNQGDWQVELKVADYPKVIELALPVIEKESKDLQIFAWLSEALVEVHGFEGLRDSLKLACGLEERFWETLFPEIDEGDMEGRANALAWMDKEAAMAIKNAPITDGPGYSFFGWVDSKKFDIPEDLESLDTEPRQKFTALKKQAEKENRTTANKWAAAIAQSKRAFYEELDVAIRECLDEFKALNMIIEEKFDRNQAPALTNLKKSLADIKAKTDKLLKQKREEEPDPVEEIEEESDGAGGTEKGSGKGGTMSTSGAIQNRRDALRRLSELASFFRKTEPHSPVSYLISRAVKWGNMPLDSWLQDVIKDESTLFQLRQTLGFNTAEGETEAEQTAAADQDSSFVT